LDIGKIVIYIYQSLYSKQTLEERFIEAYHPYLGVEIIRKFELPEVLEEIIPPPLEMECQPTLRTIAAAVSPAAQPVKRQ